MGAVLLQKVLVSQSIEAQSVGGGGGGRKVWRRSVRPKLWSAKYGAQSIGRKVWGCIMGKTFLVCD